jgi:hypothetical protein
MPRLRALQSSSIRKAGEEFDASDDEARLLCAPDALGGQKAVLVDRAMRAEETPPPPSPAKSDPAPPEKRRYLRRDLRAQN